MSMHAFAGVGRGVVFDSIIGVIVEPSEGHLTEWLALSV